MNNISKLLLVVGCQRSGTTLLASMLGGHSEINMLIESTNKEVFKLAGKKYSGNKLILYRQIRINQRASKFGHLINRFVNLDFGITSKKIHPHKLYPTSDLSIQDYIDKKAKIITIIRDESEVINSITSRTSLSEKQAKYEYKKSLEIVNLLKSDITTLHISFSDLIHKTKETLISICNYLELEFEERMLKGVEYNFIYPNKNILKEKSTN